LKFGNRKKFKNIEIEILWKNSEIERENIENRKSKFFKINKRVSNNQKYEDLRVNLEICVDSMD